MKSVAGSVLLGAAVCLCTPALASAAVLGGNAGFWAGPYIGVEGGLNHASGDYTDSALAFTYTPHVGYNAALPVFGSRHPVILGADFFAELNSEADHQNGRFGSHVYGVDALAGLPVGFGQRWMPYFKLGFGDLNGTGDLRASATAVRYGAGAEYQLLHHLGATAQWVHQDAVHVTNNDFTVGLDYHFGGY